MERQGPGSPEVTLKALSFVDGLTDEYLIADIGCGTGGQTMVLACLLYTSNNAGSGLLNASQYLEHGGLTGTILADKSYTCLLYTSRSNAPPPAR